MAGVNEDRERQVVPMWRNYRQTNRRGELAAASPDAPRPFSDDMLAEAVEDWRDAPGLSTAADLVSVALTLGRFGLAAEAARFVADHPAAPAAARGVALCYLSDGRLRPADESPGHTPPSGGDEGASPNTLFDRLSAGVRETRSQLAAYPRNPIQWSNLARLYASLGETDKADRAVRAALALAPENRFVLRSASRFYLHQGLIDRAHRLLTRAATVRTDPWLLAAEIATSAAAGRSSEHLKRGRQMLDARKYSPFHLSELASAIGTIESLAGSVKAGRRLIAFSLESPADNAIAQAAWLARKVGGSGFLPGGGLTTSFEANAWLAWRAANWRESVSQARRWLVDQPFSSRPAVLGSFLSAAVLDNAEEGVQFAEHGLRSNAGDFSLQNNLAFARAVAGDPAGARRALELVEEGRLSPGHQVTLLATRGLVAFRAGRPEVGRLAYRAAIDRARRLRDSREPVARLYLALEELRIRSPEAGARVREALEVADRIAEPCYLVAVDRLRKHAGLG